MDITFSCHYCNNRKDHSEMQLGFPKGKDGLMCKECFTQGVDWKDAEPLVYSESEQETRKKHGWD